MRTLFFKQHPSLIWGYILNRSRITGGKGSGERPFQKNLLIASLFVSALSSAQAAQVVTLDPLKEVVIEISDIDLNRVMVEGDRIVDVFMVGDALDLVPDERLGHIYIRPTQSQKDTKMTITTERGQTQDLILKTGKSRGQTIYLTDKKTKRESDETLSQKSSLALQRADDLIPVFRNFLKGDVPSNFKVVDQKSPGMTARFQDKKLEIQYWRFKNKTKNPIHVKEKDFRNDEAIKMIFIERKTLKPGEDTLIIKGLFHG